MHWNAISTIILQLYNSLEMIDKTGYFKVPGKTGNKAQYKMTSYIDISRIRPSTNSTTYYFKFNWMVAMYLAT